MSNEAEWLAVEGFARLAYYIGQYEMKRPHTITGVFFYKPESGFKGKS